MKLYHEKRFVILVALLIQSAIFHAQTERQKVILDSLKQMHHRNIDTTFIKNYFYLSGDTGRLISKYFSDGNFYFSVNAKNQQFCDTTEYWMTRFKYNDNKKSYENINSTDRYSFVNGVDTLVDRFDSYKTIDNYSNTCKINISYMLTVDKQWPNIIATGSYLKLYFYDIAQNVLFEFYYNFKHVNLLYYRKIGLKELIPVVDRIDSVYLHKITQRLWKKYELKIDFSEVKELSYNYMKTVKKSTLDQYCIIVEFVNNGEVCTFLFGDHRPLLYKRNFKQTLFYNFLDDLYYPVIYEYGYHL